MSITQSDRMLRKVVIMFWRWYSEMAYMECESGHHLSQVESMSQALFRATFWGDYGGGSISRFHYDYARELFGEQVTSIEAASGQGLILNRGTFVRYTRELIEFIAFFLPGGGYDQYPLYDDSAYSVWEWQTKDKEMTSGWWGDYSRSEVRRAIRELADGWETLIDADNWAESLWAFREYQQDYDSTHYVEWEEYWEGADSLIVNGYDPEAHARWILEQYAAGHSVQQEEVLFS